MGSHQQWDTHLAKCLCAEQHPAGGTPEGCGVLEAGEGQKGLQGRRQEDTWVCEEGTEVFLEDTWTLRTHAALRMWAVGRAQPHHDSDKPCWPGWGWQGVEGDLADRRMQTAAFERDWLPPLQPPQMSPLYR